MGLILQKYNKYDVREGDVYAWNFRSDGDVLAEVYNDDKYGLMIRPIKAMYWKNTYGTISNDYLTDFEAILVYREGRYEEY